MASKSKSNIKEVKFLKSLYTDFNDTLETALGDAGKTVKKHPVLVIGAFLLFLLWRNKSFTIENFVKKLEERIKADKAW